MWRLTLDAETWFTHLRTGTRTKFELYYYCLLAGLRARRLGEEPDGDGFLDHFPQAFGPQRHQILGLLLEAELHRLEVDYANEVDVQTQISRLLDSEAPSRLSRAGFDAANTYASAGYTIIREVIGAPPRDLSSFIIRLHDANVYS